MKRRNHNVRQYPRMVRVNELLREILGDELERLDDDRLGLVTITGVECEADLRHAVVYYDSLGGAEDDEVVLAALAEIRHRLQAAVGRQARMKNTPELAFAPDAVIRNADRIQEVLRELGSGPPDADDG